VVRRGLQHPSPHAGAHAQRSGRSGRDPEVPLAWQQVTAAIKPRGRKVLQVIRQLQGLGCQRGRSNMFCRRIAGYGRPTEHLCLAGWWRGDVCVPSCPLRQ
jgi:hypothetical protein